MGESKVMISSPNSNSMDWSSSPNVLVSPRMADNENEAPEPDSDNAFALFGTSLCLPFFIAAGLPLRGGSKSVLADEKD
jgi:hypothetical protein